MPLASGSLCCAAPTPQHMTTSVPLHFVSPRATCRRTGGWRRHPSTRTSTSRASWRSGTTRACHTVPTHVVCHTINSKPLYTGAATNAGAALLAKSLYLFQKLRTFGGDSSDVFKNAASRFVGERCNCCIYNGCAAVVMAVLRRSWSHVHDHGVAGTNVARMHL